MNPAGDKIGLVPEQRATRSASRYDAVIATLVGFCALCVSGYTAYMQRQQVRAMVWPILYFDSSNDPDIHWTLANKGVGPAIIRHVIVKFDGQPMTNWIEVYEKLVGPREPHYSESDMSGRVLSAGESMTVFTPWGPDGKPITYDKSNPVYNHMNEDRFRIEVEICYCSTLGDCWMLRGGGKTTNTTTQIRRCPRPSASSFRQ
jgi:hypothetical protein